jgi:hypothetical protein
LADHVARVLADAGIDTTQVVGVEAALPALSALHPPHVFVIEYDLIASAPPELRPTLTKLSALPIVAISMTRRYTEMHPIDAAPVAAFVYLPTMTAAALQRTIYAAAAAAQAESEPRASSWTYDSLDATS